MQLFYRRGMRTTIFRQRIALLASVVVPPLLALMSGGCAEALNPGNAAQPHLELKVYPVSCEDGRRYGAKTLKNRQYAITKVTRTGSETRVDGENKTEKATSAVIVKCGADGVSMEPIGSTMWIRDGLRFSFHQLVETADKVWPPPSGPVVRMEFYAGEEAKIEFPSELEPLGVVAIRVSVLNAGDRTLTVDPKRVKAVNESGAQTAAVADAEKRFASDAETKARLLKPIKLKKGESTIGFVFFPAGAYTGGAIALIDDQTGEADDFDVNFASS